MAHYYLDSSAIVKYYVYEAGSQWLRQLTSNLSAIFYSSDLTIAEVAAAIAVLGRTGRINSPQQRETVTEFYKHTTTRYVHLSATREIVRYAADLTQRYPLKGYDAVHLATALSLARDLHANELSLTLVSGDNQIIRAAQAENLPTATPFHYPHPDEPETTP
jgi:predicted nucleic acid-binding protein